jgi:hypothetical protein
VRKLLAIRAKVSFEAQGTQAASVLTSIIKKLSQAFTRTSPSKDYPEYNSILKYVKQDQLKFTSTRLEALGFSLSLELPKDISRMRHKIRVFDIVDFTPASRLNTQPDSEKSFGADHPTTRYSYRRVDPDQNQLDEYSELNATAQFDNPIDVLLAYFPVLKQLVQEMIINVELIKEGVIVGKGNSFRPFKLEGYGTSGIGFDLNRNFTMAIFNDSSKRGAEVGLYRSSDKGLTPVAVAEIRYLVHSDLQIGRTRRLSAYGRSVEFDPHLAEVNAHIDRYNRL